MMFRAYLRFIHTLLLTREKIYTARIRTVFDLNISSFSHRPFLLIFDYDDTLAGYNDSLPDRSEAYLCLLKAKGFHLAVYSNCKNRTSFERNKSLADIGIYVVSAASKPDPKGFLEAMKHYSVKPGETVMIGDRVSMDMYGAMEAGITHRILVEPYSKYYIGSNIPYVWRLIRTLERRWYVLSRTTFRKGR